VAELGDLVARAAAGDRSAWEALVDQFTNLVWSVARGYGLPDADAADVVQTTWLRLVEHLGRIREPERVGAWLATTARREAQTVRRRAARTVATEEERLDTGDPAAGPEALALQADRDQLLLRGLSSLPERCRVLLRVLSTDPPPRYAEVSAALDMPIGSIGPTRARCLARLRAAMRGTGLDV
jgi:RNA polymerase sigma factor (sigma-70 family)